jgi:alpha-1,3-rhamnosyl/mannosyltransferase
MSSQMKITLDCRMLGLSGIGNYIAGLLFNFARIDNEFNFDVIAPRHDSLPEPLPPTFRYVCGRSPIYGIREQWEIPRLARKADLLHCPHYNIPYFYGGAIVVTIQDLTHLLHPDFVPHRAAYHYARFMLGAAASRARKIITISQFSKNAICSELEVPEDKVRVIYRSLSPRYDHLQVSSDPARLAALGINSPYILFVGVLKPHKNVHGLIRAFSMIPPHKRDDYQLAIVGKKDRAYPSLLRLRKELALERQVIFTGQVSQNDLHLLYSGATVFVLPSLNEGFGVPALEAMAYGIPVVASNNSSLPEVVGNAGLLVDPDDGGAIANALERLLSDADLRQQLSRRGEERARLFSAREAALKHLELYREVLRA